MLGTTSATTNAGAFLEAEPFRRYRDKSTETRAELDRLLSAKMPGYTSEDTSLIVFGSLARGKKTDKSDLDWTYLIDGQANSDHLRISQGVEEHLKNAGHKEPGQTGTFGNMAFSHEIIHQIGGQFDTNRNTTQRILLLLESSRNWKQDRGLRESNLGSDKPVSRRGYAPPGQG